MKIILEEGLTKRIDDIKREHNKKLEKRPVVGDVQYSWFPHEEKDGLAEIHPCVVIQIDELNNTVALMATSQEMRDANGIKGGDGKYADTEIPSMFYRDSGFKKPTVIRILRKEIVSDELLIEYWGHLNYMDYVNVSSKVEKYHNIKMPRYKR